MWKTGILPADLYYLKSVDVETERASLLAAAEAYHDAGRTTETDSLVGLYTNDGIMIPPNGAIEEGAQSIHNYVAVFAQIPGFSIRFENVRASVAASGDMGYTLSDAIISVI